MSNKSNDNGAVNTLILQVFYGLATLLAFKVDTLLGLVVAVAGFFAVLYAAGYIDK